MANKPQEHTTSSASPASEPILRDDALASAIQNVIQSYESDPRGQHLDTAFLPSRAKTIQIIELLRKILFPGFFDDHRLTKQTLKYHVGELVSELHELLHDQLRQTLRCEQARTAEMQDNTTAANTAKDELELGKKNDELARDIACKFINCIPRLREKLILDVQAGFDGDPAASSLDEIIFCYPGLDVIFIHRVAHELYKLNVPLLPRIMSEYAHNETGADIHPGAQIGDSFFIDHATGVVIGETVIIGDRVKIYQGVTLGALSTKGGQSWRGRKRHPTIEDDVTIYPNVNILGGETVIGARCVINGSVFLIKSVPPDHTVRVNHLEPQYHPRRSSKNGIPTPEDDLWSDFNI